MPSVVQMLKSLRVPFCAGFNSSQARLALTFEITGLSHIFKCRVFSGEDVKEGKPAPDLFLHAAERCGVAPLLPSKPACPPSGLSAAAMQSRAARPSHAGWRNRHL